MGSWMLNDQVLMVLYLMGTMRLCRDLGSGREEGSAGGSGICLGMGCGLATEN